MKKILNQQFVKNNENLYFKRGQSLKATSRESAPVKACHGQFGSWHDFD